MLTTPLTSTQIQAYNAAGGSSASSSPQAMQSTFMQLLVASMQNQDPSNPMDNSQLTSQMAQINTVSGIANLNTTLSSVASQLSSLQGTTATSLVGQQVLVSGNQMTFNGTTGQGAFSLGSAAGAVSVNILGTSGQVLSTLNLGAESAGNQTFTWDASSAGVDPSQVSGFQVNASTTSGSGGTAVTATPLSLQTVTGVSMNNGTLEVSTNAGQTVNYSSIQAVY